MARASGGIEQPLRFDERASKVVELRFFAGLLEAEAADALGIAVSTLKRDWAFARAWLYDHLSARGA